MSCDVCTRKKQYESWAAAQFDLKTLRRKEKRTGAWVIVAYRCRFCPYWHIGNTLKKRT